MKYPRRIQTDESGNVLPYRTVKDVTPVVDTVAYAAGDVLFDRITCGAGLTRVNGATVVLESVTILDESDNTAAGITLVFLDSDVALGTINNAPSITDANARKVLGHVSIAAGDWVDLGASKVACVKNIGLDLAADAAAQVIYVAGITAGTPTYANATDLKLKLGFRQG